MQPSDIHIAQRARLRRITDLALERLGIADRHLVPYGHYKAKLSLDYLHSLADRPDGRLVRAFTISLDISPRKQAEALVAERDTLRVERDRALSVQSGSSPASLITMACAVLPCTAPSSTANLTRSPLGSRQSM